MYRKKVFEVEKNIIEQLLKSKSQNEIDKLMT